MNAQLLSKYRLRHNRSEGWSRLSRRAFMRTTGGVIAAGAAFSSGLLHAKSASAAAFDDPLPIPGGTPALGGGIHIFGPTPDGSFDPIDAEPSSITNFDGVVGLAYINGSVTRTSISTGAQVELPFIASDMRLMQGVYRGVDGKPRQGNFALI